MKILIRSSQGQAITIPLPNGLVFSPTVMKLYLKFAPGQTIPISTEAIKPFCAALKAYARQHGSWELLHVESAGGAQVSIVI